MHLIRVGAIDNIEQLLRNYGQNPSTVLAMVNLNSAILREPETLVSYSKLADLMEHCAVICQAPVFGFELAQMQSPLALGEFASLINQQQTFSEALHFSQNYLCLHARGLRLKQLLNNERIEIHCEFDFANPLGLQQLYQLSIGQQVEYIRVLMPTQFYQLTIHTSQSIPEQNAMQLGRYRRLLHKENNFDGISFPVSWLNKPMSNSPEVVKVWSERRIEALNACYPNDLPSQVECLCSNLMVTGECTIENVAAALNAQPRTLQRRLKVLGKNFRHILFALRQARAKQYLKDTQMNITDIAFNLGYSETAVFSRNFKQWTGKSARKWRLDNLK